MAIEIVDFPIKNGGSFHSYVSLPEGNLMLHTKNASPSPSSPSRNPKKTHPEAPQWPVPPPFAILPEPGTKMMGFGDLTKNAWWIWRFFIGYWWNIWYTGIFHGIFNGIFNGIFQKGYLLEYEFSGVNGIFNGILDESFVGFLMGFNGFFNWMFMGF